MHATGDATLALFHILQARKDLGQESAVYLYTHLDAEKVAETLKTLATSISISPEKYSTHSIRIGGATALLNGEADGLSIKLLGHWMRSCFESYPVLAAGATVGLSRRML
ncbi:hypothetical protein PC116_g16417 [Phytophthora cactorum]|nr:hypothetical protein PC119_g8842 [Phytophthora cactorum]KAG3126831.1 hypothetical protein C6341_g25200 [Phytophthora cactorum]KAG4235453.1 hypothetical protein PC116_g16417 [Phytophthora cactorum]